MFGVKRPNPNHITAEALALISQELDRRSGLIADEIGDINKALRQISSHMSDGFKLSSGRDDGLQDQISALHKRVMELEGIIAASRPATAGQRRGGALTQKSPVPAGKGIQIEYTSSSGKVSRRVVIPQQAEIISVAGKQAVVEFTGYCTTRKAVRTFIVSQISVAFDAETGEEVDPQEWILARCKA